jgi:RND family efflux transporter MFP subunit
MGRSARKESYVRVALLAAASCTGSQAAENTGQGETPPVPVEAVEVRPTRLDDTSEHVATLRSRRSVGVQPQVEGHVTRILVRSGDIVERGQVLMRIDPRRQSASVDSQRALRDARRANLNFWRREYERVRNLYEAGAVTRRDLDQALNSLSSAEAELAAQGAAVEAESVQLRYHEVVAPWDGVVGDVPVRVGDLATPQTLLTTVDDNATLELYVEIPVERSAQARLGTPVDVLDEKGGLLARSQLSFVSPRASPDTQTLLTKSLVDNRARRLRSWQLVRARVIWSTREGPAVPVLAVQSQNGQMFAWVLERTAEDPNVWIAKPRAVEVGPIQEQVYPLLRGLKVGDRVVVSGVQKLRPGAKATPTAPRGERR